MQEQEEQEQELSQELLADAKAFLDDDTTEDEGTGSVATAGDSSVDDGATDTGIVAASPETTDTTAIVDEPGQVDPTDLTPAATEEVVTQPVKIDDWTQYIEEQDGALILRADRLPDGVQFAYGDTPEDRFTKEEADYRRSRWNQRMTEGHERQQELDAQLEQIQTETGHSKVDLYNRFQEKLAQSPDSFVVELSEAVHDPVKAAWDILANRAPEFAKRVSDSFNAAYQQGAYDPVAGKQAQLDARLAQLDRQQQQEQAQAQLSQALNGARAEINTYTSRPVNDQEFGEIRQRFDEAWTLHETYPHTHSQPTWRGIYDAWATGATTNSQTHAGTAAPAATAPPRHETPGGGAGARVDSPESASDIARQMFFGG